MTVPGVWGAAEGVADIVSSGAQRWPRARLLHVSMLSCMLWEVSSGLSLRNMIYKNVTETGWAGSEAGRARPGPPTPALRRVPAPSPFSLGFGSSSQKSGLAPATYAELSVGGVWPEACSPHREPLEEVAGAGALQRCHPSRRPAFSSLMVLTHMCSL